MLTACRLTGTTLGLADAAVNKAKTAGRLVARMMLVFRKRDVLERARSLLLCATNHRRVVGACADDGFAGAATAALQNRK